jgi:SNF2 family DNA or RNA helicase
MQHFTVVQNYLVSKRLFMTGGLSGSATKDSTEDVRMKVSKQVKSELDDMFSKMETEQTSEEAQKLLLQFVATGLVATQLMDFQSIAITWMIDREIADRLSPFYEERNEKGQRVFFCSVTNSSSSSAPNPVHGGILADDMGLGKTLSTLVLVAAMKYFRPGRKGTLIICPLSVISNWSDQIESHFQHGALSVYVHHGSSRDVDALDKFDVVISSYVRPFFTKYVVLIILKVSNRRQ